MLRGLSLLLCLAGASAKGPCTDYFGPVDVGTNMTTVADTDVTEGFPFASKTFIHHTGPGSVCLSPGPPQGCHRYYVATYSGCTAGCPLADGTAKDLAGNIDTNGVFDRANGILQGCASCVKDVQLKCFGAPASDPVPCACPGSTTAAPAKLLGL